jgi:aconitate hydratase
MVAIGVGGADAVDAMSGMAWELQKPKLIGIHLTGKLRGWTSPKDVILKVAGILTVKGGTGAIVEYFGKGAQNMSATGKGTICNMGAEIGATTSIFGYDKSMARYLKATGRNKIAAMCNKIAPYLSGDPECYENPEKYFDQVIEIDLSKLEPHINGPFSPDLAWPLSKFAAAVKKNKYPVKLEVGLIGSCTNSSYEDLTRAASVADQALAKNLQVNAEYTITPGSELIRYTAERDGILQSFEKIGGVVMANACGPCIGQWARHMDDLKRPNSIMTSFNRNFTGRNDGNPNTHAFVASPELVTAFAIAGDLTFNPKKGTLVNKQGEQVKLDPPKGTELPKNGFAVEDAGYISPAKGSIKITVDKNSERLQLLKPFKPITEDQVQNMRVLIKAKGKCTTDHISMAGPWLKYRGHLENIANNCLIGATNAFNDERNKVLNVEKNEWLEVPESARYYQKKGIGSIVFGEENYGEGSSREHAAMEPRFLGVKAVCVKSFARIHQTNLKKQGLLALTFQNAADYDKIRQDDTVSIQGLESFQPGKNLNIVLKHSDGTQESFPVLHTYNEKQIEWFLAGSALNKIRETMGVKV